MDRRERETEREKEKERGSSEMWKLVLALSTEAKPILPEFT
jgi:hypothetical protein